MCFLRAGGGNGVNWWLLGGPVEDPRLLATGSIDNGGSAPVGPISLGVGISDVACLVIGPRGDFAFDDTEVDFTLTLE